MLALLQLPHAECQSAGDDVYQRLVRIIDCLRGEGVALQEGANPHHPVFNLVELVGICALSREFAWMAEVELDMVPPEEAHIPVVAPPIVTQLELFSHHANDHHTR